MNSFKHFVAVGCMIALGGCSAFTYPDGPALDSDSRPARLNKAIKAAEDLEVRYLAAAGEQAMVAKIVTGTVFLSAATAIGAALYGAHRDIITGAAFTGGTVYAASTLFGSAAQREVYRSGARALSCAITSVLPLTTINEEQLDAAYVALVAADRKYADAISGAENAMDAVPAFELKDAAFADYNAALAALRNFLDAVDGDVEAAVSVGGMPTDSIRDKLREANRRLATFRTESLAAKAVSDGLRSEAALAAVDAAAASLEALKRQSGYDTWMDGQIDGALNTVVELKDAVVAMDDARAGLYKTVINADATVARTRIDYQGWRLLPGQIDEVRSKTVAISANIKNAGNALYDISKDIHITVLAQLERLEPDIGQILASYGSVTGTLLSRASSITLDRNNYFPRSPAVGNPKETANTGDGVELPPEGGGSPVIFLEDGVDSGTKILDTSENRAALQRTIDDILAQPDLPDRAMLAADTAYFVSLATRIESLVVGPSGLQAAHTELQLIVADVRLAHSTVKDQVSNIQNVNLSSIKASCASMVGPQVKPVKPSTDQVLLTGSGGARYIHVTGGLAPFSIQLDRAPATFAITDGFDPLNGRFRYEITPNMDGTYKAGESYKLTISDQDDRNAFVTITTQ